MRATTSRLGLTLVELMVALAVIGVLTGSLGVVTRSLLRGWQDGRRALDTLEARDLVLDRLSAWIRRADAVAPAEDGHSFSLTARIAGELTTGVVAWQDGALWWQRAGEADRLLARNVTDFQLIECPAAAGRLFELRVRVEDDRQRGRTGITRVLMSGGA